MEDNNKEALKAEAAKRRIHFIMGEIVSGLILLAAFVLAFSENAESKMGGLFYFLIILSLGITAFFFLRWRKAASEAEKIK